MSITDYGMSKSVDVTGLWFMFGRGIDIDQTRPKYRRSLNDNLYRGVLANAVRSRDLGLLV